MHPARKIVVVVFDAFQLLDAAGPAQVFGSANEDRPESAQPYEIAIVSCRGGIVRSSAGVEWVTQRLPRPSALQGATLVVAGGPGARAGSADDALVGWLRKAAGVAQRTCSVCTGAFVLARTGLLEGRRIVTHWRHVDALQRLHPGIEVQGDAIYLRSGTFYSSAGVTSGIDLCLALVEEDLGREAAMRVAKRLVVYMKRPGGQRQFSAELLSQASETGTFAELIAAMRRRVESDWTIERMASAARLSSRTFQRRFTAEMGITPARYLDSLRVERACGLIERSRTSLKDIARRAGFNNEINLKNAFVRRLGMLPSEYLQRFRG